MHSSRENGSKHPIRTSKTHKTHEIWPKSKSTDRACHSSTQHNPVAGRFIRPSDRCNVSPLPHELNIPSRDLTVLYTTGSDTMDPHPKSSQSLSSITTPSESLSFMDAYKTSNSTPPGSWQQKKRPKLPLMNSFTSGRLTRILFPT